MVIGKDGKIKDTPLYQKILITAAAVVAFMAPEVISILNSNTSDEVIMKRIAKMDDPKRKEILMDILKIRKSKDMKVKFSLCREINRQINSLNEELSTALLIISKNGYNNQENRVKAWHHIINAKECLQKLQEMNIHVDDLIKEIKDAELDIAKEINKAK